MGRPTSMPVACPPTCEAQAVARAHALAQAQASEAASVLRLQGLLLRHGSLADAALAMASELAATLHCDAVALGAVTGGGAAVEILVLSDRAGIAADQMQQRLLVAAMQEAIDQGCAVSYPPAAGTPMRIVLAHAELHAAGGQATATTVLVHDGQVVGALLAQWPAAAPPDAARLALLDSLAHATGPALALRRGAERSGSARLADALRAGWRCAMRRGHPVPKLVAGAVLTGLALLTALPVDHRVGAPARVEGAVQRVVPSPLDGFLHKSHVRPGDAVRAGDLLAELTDQDLALERRKLEAALNQHENGYAAALARADRAQFVINQGKAVEARAQLDLVRQQIARTRLLAPIHGVVIKGDLGHALGAPVQRGEALLTIAPADQYRVIVEVDERDVPWVRRGATGQLALSAWPGERLAIVVERVTPVAAVRDGRNAYEVEARLVNPAPMLRPGLQGVAKIEAGERSLAWIWGHHAADWLRLAWWSWGA